MQQPIHLILESPARKKQRERELIEVKIRQIVKNTENQDVVYVLSKILLDISK
jgi:hypothetical protein